MITISLLFLILSCAANWKCGISVIYSRIGIVILIISVGMEVLGVFNITNEVGTHGGLIYTTNITEIFHIFIYIVTIIILQLTSFYPYQTDFKSLNIIDGKLIGRIKSHLKIEEYSIIILFVVIGAVFLISSNDLVSIFLSIELQSYGLYLISTINRNSELSTTGGLIYFLLGSLSSCFILLGISLLYINSGTTSLDSLYIVSNISESMDVNSWYKPYYINYSFIILMIGLLFKISAAPFHFWSPDVYDAIPTIVTTFVAIIAKISIFILLLQLVYFINNNYYLEMSWTWVLLLSSFFSLIIGTLGGLTQYRIKRLFAYSTISHVGFLLLSLSICSIESIEAFIFYLVQYSISNLNAFFILIAIGFSFYLYDNLEGLKDKINSPVQKVSQLKGYYYINSFLAISFGITIFSFAGLPPLMGFFGKQMVLSVSLDKGYIFLSLIAILTSVIGAVYYLNIIKEMFFYDKKFRFIPVINNGYEYLIKDLKFDFEPKSKIRISSYLSFTISNVTLLILLFIFGNKEWLSMGTILVQTLSGY